MTNALVVDDEPAICQCLEALFSDLDCDVSVAASAENGLELLQQSAFDVVFLDVRLPGIDGLEALAEFQNQSVTPVVVMTAHGDLSTAVSAVEKGAFDYLPKPFELEHVSDVFQRAVAESMSRRNMRSKAAAPNTSGDLVGGSLVMQNLFRQIAMAAQHDAPVLITGESGTGKELVANAIHRHSARKDHPLVVVHLASLSEGLLERELFGHSAGAFTGADQAQAGVIAQANQGTLFLDEIGETPKSTQVTLLRAIESGEFYPVGSATPERSGFRLVAATNVPIEVLKSSDRFRPDFFYRLAAIQIHVPPLRERLDDIPQLASYFLQQQTSDDSRHFTDEAIRELQDRDYPGNVRELRNIVIRAASESMESAIGVSSIAAIKEQSSSASTDSELRQATRLWAQRALKEELPSPILAASQIVESELITAAMKQTNGNRSAAAQLLGIHRETLREKLRKMEASR